MDPGTEPVEAEPSLGAFGYEYRSTGDRIVVAVEGEIDLATAPALLAALRDAVASPASAVVADLTGVEFIDSSGVHALLVAAAAARQHGSRLIVRGAKPDGTRARNSFSSASR